jgi:hypothetical protein
MTMNPAGERTSARAGAKTRLTIGSIARLVGLTTGVIALAAVSAIAAQSAAASKVALFQAVGSGAETISSGGCSPNPQCDPSDTCNCLTWSVALNGTSLGNSTFTANINLDLSVRSKNGTSGVCLTAGGFGRITPASGGAIYLNIAGNACDVADSGLLQFIGSYDVSGGKAPLTGPAGVGTLTFAVPDILATRSVSYVISGSLKK